MSDDFSRGAAFVDGRYVPVEEARIPLLDWGFLRGDANQDTISVWRGRFFRLDDHLARFERNVGRLRLRLPYDADERRRIVIECTRLTGLREAYVQMIGTRGRPPVGVRDPRRAEGRLFVFCVPYIWIATPEQQERGLQLVVSSIQRIPPESVDPTIKHYHWLDFEMGLFEAYERGGDTVVLVDRDGNLTEGPGFNIVVVKDGRLQSPEHGVLEGMTRRTVAELCLELGVEFRLASVLPGALHYADEVFLTSTAGGIMPVTRVDGRPIGDGRPGLFTRRLRELYWQKREAGWHGTPVPYDQAAAR